MARIRSAIRPRSPNSNIAFASGEQGARDQTFRLIVKPDVWGPQTRIRLSNAFGTKPITFDGAFIGLQESGSRDRARAPISRVLFGGRRQRDGRSPARASSATRWRCRSSRRPPDPLLNGRKLAVSFHVVGESGPMTWHAKALQTSYVSAARQRRQGPGRGRERCSPSRRPRGTSSTRSTCSLPAKAQVIVAFGDSITDGTGTTINGDDRWPDVLSRRLHAAYGDGFVVVNQGIGGNQVVGPADYTPAKPMAGGPSALSRLDRDVMSLPGVTTVIWLEGINDFGAANATAEAVIEGYTKGVGHLRQKMPGREDLRRHPDVGAQQHADPWPTGSRRQAQGAERVPAHVQDLRRRHRLRQGHARQGDRRGEGRVPAQFLDWRSRRQAPSQPGRLRRDGQCHRSCAAHRARRSRLRTWHYSAAFAAAEKKRFSGRGRPRFSRKVLPSYSVRNRPRRCSSGTTLLTKSSSPPGR